jgi:hypothetical protein
VHVIAVGVYVVEIGGVFVLVAVNGHGDLTALQESADLLEIGHVGEGLQLFAQTRGAQMVVHHGDTQLSPMLRLWRRGDDRPQGLELVLRDARHVIAREGLGLRSQLGGDGWIAGGNGLRDGVPMTTQGLRQDRRDVRPVARIDRENRSAPIGGEKAMFLDIRDRGPSIDAIEPGHNATVVSPNLDEVFVALG